MRVFITGATGFVGRHLRQALAGENFEIWGTSYPLRPQPSEKGIFYLDIRSGKPVAGIIQKAQPEWIFHLAAVSNVKHSWEKRQETLETNLMGTFFLLEAVRRFSPKARLLFVSSSDAYGHLKPQSHALREEEASGIVSPYAFTKVCGELLSELYSRIEGLDVVIARPFPHTGPGQTTDFVFSDWAWQITRIERGEAPPVIHVGNLDVRRDYGDVRDVVRAYMLLMQKGKRGEIYNICTGQAAPLREILDTLISLSRASTPRRGRPGSIRISVEVDPAKFRKADIPLLLGDNSKIRKETGWEPRIPLRQTLSDLLQYWRQNA
jgi:GDP-4-dehydro-6-deoxy-D-mannose reductase